MAPNLINSMQQRKNFIPINESFTCENCQKKIPKASGTFRNHCPSCLYSKHVDDTLPGDRESDCDGLMKPIGVEKDKKREWMIVQECLRCKKISRNRVAADDSKEKLVKIIKMV